MKNDLDQYLKDIARRYTDNEGERLKAELGIADAESARYNSASLDRRVRGKVFGTRRTLYSIIAAAAVLIFALTIRSAFPPQSQAPEEKIIPISFDLPKTMRIESAQTDDAETIYTITNTENDDVVMVMSREPIGVSEDMSAIKINGHSAYRKSTGDYNLLSFDKDGVYYKLSCYYDIHTLIRLAKNIL